MSSNARPSPARIRASVILLVLLAVDLLLIAGDLLRHAGLLAGDRFAITAERGYGEWFQYAQTAAVVLLLLRARRHGPAAFVWAGLFAYLLADDAWALHETAGRALASRVALPVVGAIRPEQLGELVVFAVVGCVFVAACAVFAWRGGPAFWRLSAALIPPFAALVFFGAFVDVLHSFLSGRSYRYAAGLIEDGGEMIVMSVLVAICYRVVDESRLPSPTARARS